MNHLSQVVIRRLLQNVNQLCTTHNLVQLTFFYFHGKSFSMEKAVCSFTFWHELLSQTSHSCSRPDLNSHSTEVTSVTSPHCQNPVNASLPSLCLSRALRSSVLLDSLGPQDFTFSSSLASSPQAPLLAFLHLSSVRCRKALSGPFSPPTWPFLSSPHPVADDFQI